MNKLRNLTTLALLVIIGWSYSVSAREKININRSWKFHIGDIEGAERVDYDDASWCDAHLPHSFAIPYFLWDKVYHGDGWYRKKIHVPEEWKGQCVEVEFEGAFLTTEIFVNGVKIGTHVGGYTGFTFDLSSYLRTGDNLLAVKVNNSWKGDVAPRAGDHQFAGGIYRDAYLNITAPVRVKTNGTFVHCNQISTSSASMEVCTEIINSLAVQQVVKVTTRILNPSGQEVSRHKTVVNIQGGGCKMITQQMPTVSKPCLWSPEHPDRYTAITTLSIAGKECDRYVTKFGVRWMEWTTDRGFFLNGEHYWLRGANVHQDQAGWGDAVTNGAAVRDVKMMKDAGFNCIRGSHYPHDVAFAQACDSLGMILFMEMNFWGMGGNADEGAWGIGAPASAYPTMASLQDAFDQNVLAQLKEMIVIHRNSPSIAAWSLCNEPFFNAASTDKRMKQLLDLETDSARRWDPTREVAIGGCQRKGIDKLGKNQIAFYNGDGASRAESQNPGVPNLVSEYGSTVAERPGKFEPGWGDVKDGLTNQPAWRSGHLIWCGFDHGTVGGTSLAKMGIVDYFRLPKRAYYWYQQAYRDSISIPCEPQWPEVGVAAALAIEASQTEISSCNGTDDAQIIVSVVDKNGKRLSNNVPVTLSISHGPGEFPTGRSITFMPPSSDEASDIQMCDGLAAITFRSYYAGQTTITATSDGLKPATITITSLGDADWEQAGRPICKERPYQRYIEPNEVRTNDAAFTLAENRPTKCSSENMNNHTKGYANDGDVSTYWESAVDDGSPWWMVFLEAHYNVDYIQLTFPDTRDYQYIVEVSHDGENWIPAVNQSNTLITDKVHTATGNFGADIGYVRVRFGSSLAALAEIRVGGTRFNVTNVQESGGSNSLSLSNDTIPAKLTEYETTPSTTYIPGNLNTLWYLTPATSMNVGDPWMDYALPIGNGQLGAMIYGGIRQDVVQFNEKTLWTGSSTERGAYQNFGQLYIEDLPGRYPASGQKSLTGYYRSLDIERAVATSSWMDSEGVVFTRHYIASFPGQCIAIRLEASKPGSIHNHFYLYNAHGERPTYYNGEGVFRGKLTTVSFNARMKVITEGGETMTDDTGVWVRKADAVTVIIAAGTDYSPQSDGYVADTPNLDGRVTATIRQTASHTWQQLLSCHVDDYQTLFSRVSLSLDGASNAKPTEALISEYKKGFRQKSFRQLEQLYFQYGRYMLICSSRGVDVPSNLQGIWNNSNDPAWQCDMHANINVQMNYWPAENTHLPELHEKYLNYLYNMAVIQPQWRDYAKSRCGQTKGWANFTENNLFGHCTTWHNDYCEAGAWSCDHLWQHYRYTLDTEFLHHKALPVMIGACDFWMERLVKAQDGTWECPNEWSPEHGPDKTVTAHAQQLVWNLLDKTRQAIDIVGIDSAYVSRQWIQNLDEKLAHMDKGLATEVYDGHHGHTRNGVTKGDTILKEWKYYTYAEGNGKEKDHRHLSHLMSLYPLSIITPTSPYFKPALNSLKLRGIESQGWSMGWKINLWARALDGNQCAEIFKLAFKHSSSYTIDMSASAGGVYYNLLDAHSPFQIDGNLGVCAGIAEMLLQSYNDTLQLLPALPDIWDKGEVKGLKAIGNFTVNERWSDKKLTEAVIASGSGQECRVVYKGVSKASVCDHQGLPVQIGVIDTDHIVFPTSSGSKYIITMPSD